MKKHFLKLLIIFIFFLSPMLVKANFGDLRYEVTKVNINGSKITFEGWAYIHRTNNFMTVKVDGSDVVEDGDQKVIMEAYVNNNRIDIQSNILTEAKMDNYNFYCELFYRTESMSCTKNNYKNVSRNSCQNNSSGVAINTSQCYYEDINFKITFDISSWNVSDFSDITFKIAVSNADYENKMNNNSNKYNYNGDFYTMPEVVSIADAAVTNMSNDFIEIVEDSLATDVEFIASTSFLYSSINVSTPFKYSSGLTDATCVYGAWQSGNYYQSCSNNIYQLFDSDVYPEGRSKNASGCSGKSFLGSDCKGTYYYSIKINGTPANTGMVCAIACPVDESAQTYSVAIAHGSHIKPTGQFKIKVKNDKKCRVTNPFTDKLECNKNLSLSSTCNELTVNTSVGSAVVKIEQIGNISSILTPGEIYAGGGFKFGIMYYNSIKWSYVNDIPGNDLHTAVTSVMNKKIKEYNTYVAAINITEMNLGGNIFNGMVKKCYTSNEKKDYYNKELTVSCVFTFPDSVLEPTGNVEYSDISSSSININNKYYTPLDYYGNYKIEATIVGMDRITSGAAISDSEGNTSWTGSWSTSFEGCEINLYSLFYKNGRYNFIYRPIDIDNPFPNRNAGFNWFDWYNVNSNKYRLNNTYLNDASYVATLDNKNIADIKNYNKNNNYLYWNSIDGYTGESSFITENNYVDRVGGY